MIKPVEFPEKNFVFTAPQNMPECGELPAHLHGAGVLTCWEFDDEDIEIIQKTKRVWINLHSHTIAPISLTAEMPFQEPVEFPTEIDDPDKG